MVVVTKETADRRMRLAETHPANARLATRSEHKSGVTEMCGSHSTPPAIDSEATRRSHHRINNSFYTIPVACVEFFSKGGTLSRINVVAVFVVR